MKTRLFTAILLFIFYASFCQEKSKDQSFKRNELKINAAYLIAGGAELIYERIINQESAAGISIFVALDDELSSKFSLTPIIVFILEKNQQLDFSWKGLGC